VNGGRRLGSKGMVIACLLVSQALDLITTYVGFGRGLREGNIVPSAFLSFGGTGSLIALKLVMIVSVLGLALLLQSRYPRLWRGVMIASMVTLLAVASNAVSIVLAMP
jgi:hypothetical protein